MRSALNVQHSVAPFVFCAKLCTATVYSVEFDKPKGVYHCAVCDKLLTMYTLDRVASLFDTSRENARRWCLEFQKFLSDSANPPSNRKRLLNDDDLSVISLIAEMKGQGHIFTDIHAALEQGRRGILPSNPAAVVPADKTKLAKLQSDVNRLTEALQLTMDENQGLKGENRALRDELEAAKRDLKEAYKEIGKLEANIKPPPYS